MTSSAYLQEITPLRRAKPDRSDNRLLWRRRPLRLNLKFCGLDLACQRHAQFANFRSGSEAPLCRSLQARIEYPYPKDAKDTPAPRRPRYPFSQSVVQHPLMQAFDWPDAQASCGRRENTTVGPASVGALERSNLSGSRVGFRPKSRDSGRIPNLKREVQLCAWRLAPGP